MTQWQVVGCCETISEAQVLPVLEAMLHLFPFRIRGLHSDNGSEFLRWPPLAARLRRHEASPRFVERQWSGAAIVCQLLSGALELLQAKPNARAKWGRLVEGETGL